MLRNKYFAGKRNFNLLIIVLFVLFFCFHYKAHTENSIILLTLDNPAPGYLLMDSYQSGYLTVIDNSGLTASKIRLGVNESARSFKQQTNGLFTYFANKKFYVINKNFVLIDSFACKNGLETDFHDFKLLSNGNALLLGMKYDTVDMSAVVTGGNPNAILISFVIQEQDVNKNVVWEWIPLDHFNVTDATDETDLTQQQIAWEHTNWIEIDNDGNLITSNRNMDEITKINKQTGDIIWRLGGKKCKNNQFTFLNDTVNGFWGFSHQHSVHRLSNGNLLLFDNGNLKPTQFSRAVEYEIDEVNKTVRKVWEYKAFPEVFAMSQGSVQRLPNGNTIIGWGTNTQQMTTTEVLPDGTRAIDFRNYESYMAMRYPINMDSKLLTLQNTGNYNFSDTDNKTAVSLNIQSLTGSGFVSVERHYYLPHNLTHDETVLLTTYGHRWVLNNKGISKLSGKIIFKLSEIDSLNSPEKNKIYWRKQEGNGNFTILETTYNQSLGTLEANISAFGEFIIGEPPIYEVPELISPMNNSKKNSLNVSFLWDQAEGADSYKLQVSLNNNFSSNIVDTVIIADTTFSFQTFQYNSKYYWRLKSMYGSNVSSWSNVWNFTTQLMAPEQISPVDSAIDFSVNGLFKWNSVPGATYYKLSISESADFDTLVIDETGITDTIYSLAVLDYNKIYFWRINAMNFDNESMWSDTNTFNTEERKLLSTPVLLFPESDTFDVSINGKLKWSAVTEATGYNVELSLYSDFITDILMVTGVDSTSFNYSGLSYNTLYYWHVAATNQDDTSSWSDTWNFRTQEFKDVRDSIYLEFDVFYFDGKIIFQPKTYFNMSYFTLLDVTGRNIISHSLIQNKPELNCGKLMPGIYFYFININSEIRKGKLLIY